MKGLRNPNGDFPAAMRASLRSATTPEKVGEEALVPVDDCELTIQIEQSRTW